MSVVEQYRGFSIELSLQNKMYAVIVREGTDERYTSQFAFPSPVDAAEHGMEYVDQVIGFKPLEEEARKTIIDRHNRMSEAISAAVESVITEELGILAAEQKESAAAERRKR